jgi:hypothetical protein
VDDQAATLGLLLAAVTDSGRALLMSREYTVVDAMVRALADECSPAERRQLESAIPLINRLAHRL